MTTRPFGLSFILASLLVLLARDGVAALYYGNQYGPESGSTVSGGTLSLTDNGSTIFGTFTPRQGNSFGDNLVIFIDTVRDAGFTSTDGLPGGGSTLQRAISGDGTSRRSTANFASSFGAEYAIALNATGGGGGSLFSLVGGSNPAIGFIQSVSLSPDNNVNSASYTFRFDLSQIGDPQGNSFRFQSTYITDTGYRTIQSFEQLSSGSAGFGTITFNGYNLYGVEPVPEMTNVALVVFGGLVVGAGVVKRVRRHFPKRK